VFRVRKFGRSKFGNIKAQHDGITYHSKFERDYAAQLDLRKKAKDILDWRRQVRIPLEVNGYLIANYYIDFVIDHNDGSTEYVEVKGFETDVWRMKWKLFESLYSKKPLVTLTVVKR
jgi:hypothetical protein